MSTFDINMGIEKLLKEQPNQIKPERRRRNKQKDYARRARQGVYTVPEKDIRAILGDQFKTFTKTIEYMSVSYEKTEIPCGRVNGWYDSIKEIEKELNAQPNTIRLVKEYGVYDYKYIPEDIQEIIDYVESCGESVNKDDYYEYKETYQKTNTAYAYQSVYTMNICFLDENKNKLLTWGYSPNISIYVYNKDCPEGLYDYDQTAIDYLEKYQLNVPKKKYVLKNNLNHFLRYPEQIKKHITSSEYQHIQKLLEIRETSQLYGKTYRLEKGDKIGSRNRLINAVNNKSNTINQLDKEFLDYEFSHYQDVYEYIW